MNRRKKFQTDAFSLSLLSFLAVRAEDWPQWRGPNRDGVWRETGIIEAIPASGLEVRWRAKVGNGFSGPVVAQGRVFPQWHLRRRPLPRRSNGGQRRNGRRGTIMDSDTEQIDVVLRLVKQASPACSHVFTRPTA